MRKKTVYNVIDAFVAQKHVKTFLTYEEAEAFRTSFNRSAFDIIEVEAIEHEGELYVPKVVRELEEGMLIYYRNNKKAIDKANEIKSQLSGEELKLLIDHLK